MGVLLINNYQMLATTTKNAIIDYCNDSPRVNYSTIKDLIIDYLEPKNLKDESIIISEITNKLINIRNLIKKHDFDSAKAKFEELENRLNNL